VVIRVVEADLAAGGADHVMTGPTGMDQTAESMVRLFHDDEEAFYDLIVRSSVASVEHGVRAPQPRTRTPMPS
jgi:hypothetical protein